MILFAGNFHFILGQVNFNLCIARVTFFFDLFCFLHYMETGDSEAPQSMCSMTSCLHIWISVDGYYHHHSLVSMDRKSVYEDRTGAWGAWTGSLMNQMLCCNKHAFILNRLLTFYLFICAFKKRAELALRICSFLPPSLLVMQMTFPWKGGKLGWLCVFALHNIIANKSSGKCSTNLMSS